MPTTKGTRAIPATVLPTPPALPTVTTTAARIPSAPIFSAIDPAVIAWNTPLVVDTSAAGTNASTATVATMYIPAISTPDAYTARGSVFSDDVRAHRRAGQQQPREIKHRVNPVVPASHEAVKISERLFGPDVESALFRKSR